MDNIKKISYRPILEYVDEYESDITFNNNQEQDGGDNADDGKSPIDDLLEQGEILQEMIDKLPDDISDIIKDHADPIIDFVENELKDKELTKVPVEIDWEYNADDETGDPYDDETGGQGTDNPDIKDIWEPDDDIPIVKKVYKKEQIVEKEYVKNLYDLFTDYYSELNSIVSNFWSTLLYSIMNKQSSEIDVIMNNIVLSSSEIKEDKKHLLDLAVKSEISKNMKLKYFSNNFDAEGSMKHLKQFKAVYELRLRYAKINKDEAPASRADQMSNNMLQSMSLVYSNKYDKSYENLYRYLSSSNMILRDSLNSAAQSIKAKQILIDTKGVK